VLAACTCPESRLSRVADCITVVVPEPRTHARKQAVLVQLHCTTVQCSLGPCSGVTLVGFTEGCRVSRPEGWIPFLRAVEMMLQRVRVLVLGTVCVSWALRTRP
jgi:hypothetical protein